MEQLSGVQTQLSHLMEQGLGMAMTYAPRLILAITTLVVGLWVIRHFVTFVDRKLGPKDPTLNSFLCGLISIGLKIMLLISVAAMIGIATTSFIAVIGAAGLAVGLALQGSLANFAGGVLILIFKPFKVGDAIEAQAFVGSVIEIRILYTVLNTFDNRRVVIPNGHLSNGSLINISANDTRRCDMSFGIGYGDDIDKAKAICKRLIEEDERALAEPAPVIVVGGLGDSSVNLTVRVWTQSSNLWPFFWDMQEQVKKAFDTEGISIPFPQRDVHMYQAQ